MIILSCADSAIAKKSDPSYQGFSFRGIISSSVKIANKCGYLPAIYDLGTLGIGEKFSVIDSNFKDKGYYEKEVIKGYKSRSLFKPELVELVMNQHSDLVVYLDGDAQLVGCLDEIAGADYDVGVTVRPKWETESEWHKQHFEIVKYLNAGVIFFNPTEAARQFVVRWKLVTAEVGNDQMSLNRLACPEHHPSDYAVEIIDGVRIKYFPCERYNFYFFGDIYPHDAKILHFKGNVRNYYPFAWKNRLFAYWQAIFVRVAKKDRKAPPSGKTEYRPLC